MGEFNSSATTTTDFTGTIDNFEVSSVTLDKVEGTNKEVYWYFKDAKKHLGYYSQIPEIFNAVNALATWAVSRGWEVEDNELKAQLDHVKGNGNDSFNSVVWSHLVIKNIVGDAFIEVKRGEENKILNMIPISPERIRIVYGRNGLIKRYDVRKNDKWIPIKKSAMLHSSNKKLVDQMHGTSQITSAKNVIDARNEAFDDERAIKHRDKALGIVYYKTDKAGKISYINSQIEDAVKNGEMLGLPEGVAEIKPYPSRSSEDRQGWIQYLENFFYQIFGVPRSIASSDGTSEVGGKMGHVIFEPIYTKEQVDLESDLWNQQAIKIKFNRPPTLGGLQEDKNTGQQNIQPNDVGVTLARE